MDAVARTLLAVVVLTCSVGRASAAEPFPALPATTLSERTLQLPADLPPVPVVFVVGFSRAARMQTQPWGARIHEVYSARTDMGYYQAAIIEDVPRLMRGLVSGRIRSGVPDDLHDHFLLVSEQAQQWRKLADVADPDSAYLILLDRDRSVAWHSAGPLTERSYATFAARLEQLINPVR